MNYIGWLIVFVVFAALELISLGMTCIWFAIGALAACVTSLFTGNWIIQAIVFIVVTVIVLLVLRPIAVKYINNKAERTNVESMEGKTGKVISEIDNINAKGMVLIDGMEWTARSVNEDIIPENTLVEVVAIEGVKAMQMCYSMLHGIIRRKKMEILLVVIVLAIVVTSTCVKIVPQAHSYVIERLGVYKETWSVGIHFKVPFLDRISRRVNLKEQVADFEPQPVITRDNVTMQIDTIIFYQITDPKLYAYGVENPIVAIKSLTATTLRNIVGDLELDETLTSRETINAKMRTELDVATDPWGIKVNRVELKNIIPPRDIQEAMEKQMRAEREKREQILRAEGEKKSAVLIAEGKKEAAILNAQADKEAAVLKADAEKQKKILEAEGEAQAILKVQQATADGIKVIKEAGADEAVLTMKSLEAFAAAADGQATKIIIPSDIQGIAGSVKALAEVIKE